jgi:hypothetical protein
MPNSFSLSPNSDKPAPAPKTPNAKLVDDTIILTLNPGADMDKVNEIVDEVHGTITKKLHVEKEDYWILFVKPPAGEATKTYKELLSKKDKNFRAIGRNFQINPGKP